jgi:hypothetical protein
MLTTPQSSPQTVTLPLPPWNSKPIFLPSNTGSNNGSPRLRQ